MTESHHQQPWPYYLVGSTLPQALRLARCQVQRPFHRPVDEIPSESDVIEQAPTREEERILATNAAVVSDLEGLYSWLNKDRTSRSSKLTPIETWRFRSSLYRTWLLTTMEGHGSGHPSLEFDDNFKIVESSYMALAEAEGPCLERQRMFLDTFTSSELQQIREVATFLKSLGFWAMGADGNTSCIDTYDWGGIFLYCGPRAILRAYEERTIGSTITVGGVLNDDGPTKGFLWKSLKKILDKRNVSISENLQSMPVNSFILDTRNGRYDRCSSCSSMTSLDGLGAQHLYNETNWDYLEGVIGLDFQFYLPLELRRNPAERGLGQAVSKINRGSRLMQEMFASKSEKYRNWSEDKWVCGDCIQMFIVDTIPFWRLDQKRAAGETIQPDCRSGYTCNLQQDMAHAKKFNHLCEPLDQASA
ncbi:uncharacterized protein LAESUDRAFT_727345 [Laetiporus sulphureus 93-53]|uniref:Aprataxin and PNK-like factor PBZ domain-containing protein n=1 Tax=Laetiporus sulphureus 93-53 TaxID=1314785 RepID=A0A165DKN2_9APHY|nr:uncharacterized protein LAESUDRAFT_727345 [Laetiporus sulphureus 93-53]KZT05093.1 hypothetical protein LAESUDRAFT_727345 [Laetiporus sulphureus 93-53]